VKPLGRVGNKSAILVKEYGEVGRMERKCWQQNVPCNISTIEADRSGKMFIIFGHE
jgi:hypothetical protein